MVSGVSPQWPKSRRILVIEEEQGAQDILLEPLRWEGYAARAVSSVEEALTTIGSGWIPQIVLIDLPAHEKEMEALRLLREKLPTSSLLHISEDSSTNAIIRTLDSGADDYIVKPFIPLELLARIRTHLRIRDLHDQLVIANAKLKELVDTDDLTGLFNMRSLYQRLDFELERSRRFRRGLAVCMMDMDYFKSVNDGHDHLFGSYVISEVGKIIKSVTRNTDIPARYGGDEFLVVLTENSPEGVRLFCERLNRAVRETTFTSGKDSIRLTISIGYAIHDPEEVITSRELVRRADHALYEAKRAGRDRICMWSGDGSSESSNVVVLDQGRGRKSSVVKKKKKAG
ncbi:MAG: diguanylate cyclase [Bdellovibrionaceae bacterium]|nr:diguanylate cyclase [Pseudobdellovibrionaceae bacterium]